MSEGTRVTATDLETGESESVVIVNNYVVITDGRMTIDGVQRYGNGTVIIICKREQSNG